MACFNQTEKATGNATKPSQNDAGDMVLIVQSRDGGDEAFLTLTADEIYAMAYADEGTPRMDSRISFRHAPEYSCL